MDTNQFLIELQAKLEEASLNGIKGNLDQLKKEFAELKIKPHRPAGSL